MRIKSNKSLGITIFEIVVFIFFIFITAIITLVAYNYYMTKKYMKRVECIDNQYKIIYSLYMFKDEKGFFPERLDQLVSSGHINEIPKCPSGYEYDYQVDKTQFTLLCRNKDKNPPHEVFNKKPVTNQELIKRKYPYYFERLKNNKDVSHFHLHDGRSGIFIWPRDITDKKMIKRIDKLEEDINKEVDENEVE